MIDKKAQGKASRAKGARFELKVRKDLEAKGWIVDKWTNNLQILDELHWDDDVRWEMHPARSNRFNMRSTGFPDFIAFREYDNDPDFDCKQVIGVEVKTHGTLKKIEKEKCDWYLESNIFSKILIAFKGDDGVEYKEYGKT